MPEWKESDLVNGPGIYVEINGWAALEKWVAFCRGQELNSFTARLEADAEKLTKGNTAIGALADQLNQVAPDPKEK